MKNKLFTFLLAMMASMGTLRAVVYSGSCGAEGNNLLWSLDSEDGVLTISGTGPMEDYEYLHKSPWFSLSDIFRVNILNGVTSIGSEAFRECIYMTSITIPNSVTTIGMNAFNGCTGLTSVTIPNSVTRIGDDAFSSAGLISVTIPSSVIRIGTNAFGYCTSLTSIDVAIDNPNYSSIDGVLFNKDKTTLMQYPCDKQGAYTIPNSITSIGQGAFRECTGLTSVTIPNSVTSIWGGAFSGCTSLTSIEIPNSVTSIVSNTFSGCTELNSISIPNSVTSIGDDAFSGAGLISVTIPSSVIRIGISAFNGCFSLTSLTIPSSVTSIGTNAFGYCTSLTSIDVAIDNPNYSSIDGVLFKKDKTTLMQYPCGRQGSYTIPDSVKDIGYDSFSWCIGLTSVVIPNSVISIGNYTFSGCAGLTSVTNYATTPQTINANVFFSVDLSACTLYVPAASLAAYQAANIWKDFGTILAIGEEPCTPLSGTCGENLTWELTCDSVLTISGTGAMWRLTEEQAWRPYKEQIKTAILPEGLDSIAPKAFYQCVNLTSVNLPNSVRALGTKAFVECYKLAEPVYNERIFAFLPKDYSSTYSVPEGIVSVAAYAISYLLPTAESNAIPSSLKEIVLPSSLKRLGISSLAGAQLEKITCYATTPPVCAQSVFDYYYDEVGIVLHSIDRSIPVYVPAESVEAYKAANQWSSFFNILPIEEPIETVEADYNVVYTGHDDNELSSEFITLHVPVAPEIEGFTFLKWQVVAGDLEDGIVIEAVYTADAPLSAPAVYTDPANPAIKLIRDGNVYILKGNKTYTITGQEVK